MFNEFTTVRYVHLVYYVELFNHCYSARVTSLN